MVNNIDYIRDAQCTKSELDFPKLNQDQIDCLHGAMGLCTESAELLDAYKKFIFYGKPIDEVNLVEELGDIFWYLAIFTQAAGFDWSDIMERNLAKLRQRYPNKFTTKDAVDRDLEKERNALSGD